MSGGFTSTWQTQHSRNGLTFLFGVGECERCKNFNSCLWNNYMNTKESHNEDAIVNPSWSCLGYIQELKHPGAFVSMPFIMLKMEGRKLDATFKLKMNKV